MIVGFMCVSLFPGEAELRFGWSGCGLRLLATLFSWECPEGRLCPFAGQTSASPLGLRGLSIPISGLVRTPESLFQAHHGKAASF